MRATTILAVTTAVLAFLIVAHDSEIHAVHLPYAHASLRANH